MGIYISFCTMLLLFSCYEVNSSNKKIKAVFLIISFIGAVLIIGGRWETGTDWEPYLYFFEESKIWKDVIDTWKIEIGYGSLNWIVRNISSNYSIFLFIHAFIFYGILIKAFSKITLYPQTAFMFYFATNLGIVGSNRQLIAAALIIYGVSVFSEKKLKSYVFLLFISLSFHATSLLGGVYILLNKYISNKVIWVTLIVALFVGISSLPLKIFGSIGILGEFFLLKTEAYLDNVGLEEGLTLIGTLKRVFFFGFFFLFRDKIAKKSPHYNLIFNGYWFGIVFYLIFANTLPVMISRGSLYFNIMESILFACFVVALKDSASKIMYLLLIFFLSIVLMYQSIAPYPLIFDPYKSIWYNTNYYRILQ